MTPTAANDNRVSSAPYIHRLLALTEAAVPGSRGAERLQLLREVAALRAAFAHALQLGACAPHCWPTRTHPSYFDVAQHSPTATQRQHLARA